MKTEENQLSNQVAFNLALPAIMIGVLLFVVLSNLKQNY